MLEIYAMKFMLRKKFMLHKMVHMIFKAGRPRQLGKLNYFSKEDFKVFKT